MIFRYSRIFYKVTNSTGQERESVGLGWYVAVW